MNTKGAALGPSSSVEAIASPLGGQTGVALGFTDANVRPTLASMK